MKAMDTEGSGFAFLQKFPWISMEKLKAGIFDGSQIIHGGPNVWQSTEQSWTVQQAVTEVSSYKLPGKPAKCRIQEGNWWATEECPPILGTNVKLNFLRSHLDIFQRTVEIWVKSWVSTFTKTFTLWKRATKAGRM